MTLPPLPNPDEFTDDGRIYSADQMHEYATAAVMAEREACATLCDLTPPYPFRASIEAAHAIRARSAV
jgi:hypothetical protein